jgi:hypothetical protein
MFRSKTVFVLGAGSSEEVGLPVGSKLKERISTHIKIRFDEFGQRQIGGSAKIVEALRKKVALPQGRPGDINPYIHVAWKISDALPQAISIDNFLDAFNTDDKIELCGKLGIVASILDAERSSSIYINEKENAKLDTGALGNTWFAGLMQLLTEGIRLNTVGDIFNNIAIVNFNYDRCVEHFLYHSLINYYGISPNQAVSLLANLKIIHPYGTVGTLSPQAAHQNGAVVYGSERCDLLAASEQIKTFTERIQEQVALDEIKNTMRTAETIVFLGFAFHRQNLDLLEPVEESKVRKVFATALGVSKSDCEIIEAELKALFKQKTNPTTIEFRNDLKCNQLFNEYWRSLSA